ncbi:hypothetical protein LSH36_1387g00008 [Paralvinella palmiformis]|uniref:THAP-type domain-containing protein n=1 Tax=Paralvinella palmiformis TaxID=53620 RepID=A0AAD9MQS8_9ANNE|nr:hypothetical protein LSH36_1387g00008 [Paralvinella palmiformis]
MKDGPEDSTEKSAKTHEKYCCVTNCHNTSEKVLPDGHKIMLHRLPAESKTRNVWVSRLRTIRKNLPVNDSTRVCSAHFENYDETILPYFPARQPNTDHYQTGKRTINNYSCG